MDNIRFNEQIVIDKICRPFDVGMYAAHPGCGQVDLFNVFVVEELFYMRLPGQVEMRIKAIEGVSDAKVELVWDPPWTPEKMSEAAKLELNMDIPSTPPQPPPLFDLNPRPPG